MRFCSSAITALTLFSALTSLPVRAQVMPPSAVLRPVSASAPDARQAALSIELADVEARTFELYRRGTPRLVGPKIMMIGGFVSAAALLSLVLTADPTPGTGVPDGRVPAMLLAAGGLGAGITGGVLLMSKRATQHKHLTELARLRQRRAQLRKEQLTYGAAAESTAGDKGRVETSAFRATHLAELNQIDDQLADIVAEASTSRTAGPKTMIVIGMGGLLVGALGAPSALASHHPDPALVAVALSVPIASAGLAAGGFYLLQRRTAARDRRVPEVRSLRLRKRTLLRDLRESSSQTHSGFLLELGGSF